MYQASNVYFICGFAALGVFTYRAHTEDTIH